MSHTLLMRFAAPMQSWGTRSRFDERDTELEPSKSGVIGLVCAALGVDREEETAVLELAAMPMGVRVDREGVLRRDYHTIRAHGKGVQDTAVSNRYYLADAVFLVGLESPNRAQLEGIQAALKNPVWPLSFGRKSFVPSQPVWLEDGLKQSGLEEALRTYPPLTLTKPTRIVLEADRGSLRMDNPISSFAKRRYGARFVESKTWEEFRVPEQARP